MPTDDRLPVRLRALVMDPVSNVPVVILERLDESRYLPIWIGLCEANAIALELEGVKTPRPMTHDLITSLIQKAGYRVQDVFIHTLLDNVFYATVRLVGDDGQPDLELDSRPSDALAVAIRSGADIYVSQQVIDDAGAVEASEEETTKEILARLRPDDMGQYEM